MKEVDRGTFSVVELAPVKRKRKSTVIITKKRARESKKLKESEIFIKRGKMYVLPTVYI